MTFKALLGELLTAGESAYNLARVVYVQNLEGLASAPSSLPGEPAAFTVSPVDTLMPRSLRLQVDIELKDGDGDGRIDATFAGGQRRALFGDRGRVATLTIEWGTGNVPEGVARIVDAKNAIQDTKLVELKKQGV